MVPRSRMKWQWHCQWCLESSILYIGSNKLRNFSASQSFSVRSPLNGKSVPKQWEIHRICVKRKSHTRTNPNRDPKNYSHTLQSTAKLKNAEEIYFICMVISAILRSGKWGAPFVVVEALFILEFPFYRFLFEINSCRKKWVWLPISNHGRCKSIRFFSLQE